MLVLRLTIRQIKIKHVDHVSQLFVERSLDAG